MKKMFLRVIALVLAFCAMQVAFVPAVSAASISQTYDFYSSYKTGTSYTRLYGTSNAVPKSDFDSKYNTYNWKVEVGNGYANFTTSSPNYVSMYHGIGAYVAFRFKVTKKTGVYDVDINYVATKSSEANLAAEFLIVPANNNSYTQDDLKELAGQNRWQARVSCYNENGTKQECATFKYQFEQNQEYLLLVRGGPSQGNTSNYGATYLKSMTVSYAADQTPLVKEETPNPVALLEESLVRWEDDFAMVAQVHDEDYFALPIYGGKMYIYNLDTWKLVDEVNTGIQTPRGMAVKDGVLYVGGDNYTIYKYNLHTNQPGRSCKMNISAGIGLGSIYDIHLGDDGYLYFGTDKGHILRYDTVNDKFTKIAYDLNGASYNKDGETYKLADNFNDSINYVPAVIKNGNYLYASMHTADQALLVKLDASTLDAGTAKVLGICDFTATGVPAYLTRMSIIPGDGATKADIICGGTSKALMAVDTKTMTLLTASKFGMNKVPADVMENKAESIVGYVSEEIEGKYYFVESNSRYLYVYDPKIGTAALVNGGKNVQKGFVCQGESATLTFDGVEGTYVIGFTEANTHLYAINVETGVIQNISNILVADGGASSNVNSVTLGPDGKLYYGGFTSDWVGIYDPATGAFDKTPGGHIQTDALCVYEGEIYAGNYTGAMLTRLNTETDKPDVLFTLNNTLFDQARIHSIVAGDDKIFLGTFADIDKYGGVIAWFDTSNGHTYVAVGPNPEDVYWAETFDTATGTSVGKPVWYNVNGIQVSVFDEKTGEDISKEIKRKEIFAQQGMKDVAYYNYNGKRILYVATSTHGGTGTGYYPGASAKIFAYDIDKKEVIAIFDPITEGFASPVRTISGIEVDKNGTLWCVVSETLFTLTLNGNAFTYEEQLSFDKISYDETQNRENSSIVFRTENGVEYIYVAFERIGGLRKVLKNNPSVHESLLPNVASNGAVPEHFTFGTDGNFYYLQGSKLMTLAISPTENEWSAAAAVTAQINAITPETISAVREAYDALTLRQKSLVQNYDVLVQAEANAFMQEIDELCDNFTQDQYDQLLALIDAYKQMPESKQNKITNYYRLVNTDQELQQLVKNATVVAIDDLGGHIYYKTLEEALDKTTEGTIRLLEDVTAKIVDVHNNAVLDLDGHTLKADIIFAKVMDSSDGEGLIEVKKNTAEDKYATLTPDDQLILWDNNASGYRLFNYNFENMGKDAKENDASESLNSGTTVMSFWSKLTFGNRYAYTLIASGYSDLNVSFDVSWTPEGGTTSSRIFAFTPSAISDWALEEEQNEQTDVNYCFYIRLTGFDALKTNGTVAVKPCVSTAFNTVERDPIPEKYDYKQPIDRLKFEEGYGDVANATKG